MLRRLFSLPLAIVATLLALTALPAAAHLYAASDAGVSFNPKAGEIGMRFAINLEAILAGVDPEVRDTSESPNAQEYNRLRALPPAELEQAYKAFEPRFLAGLHPMLDGKPVTLTLERTVFPDVGDVTKARKTEFFFHGQMPPDAKEFTFGWDPSFGKVMLRTLAAHPRSLHILALGVGETSEPILIENATSRSTIEMVLDFMRIGFHHILPLGTDHILFVVGIFLLSTRVKPILTQVTAFTVAHTITLGLGTAGYVNINPAIVEPLIAASIVYVAVENILTPVLTPWRPVVVFCFGLLHGLGFAGILRDFKLPPEDFLVGLLSFNVGVELGQLAIITACFLLVGIWFGKKPWYRQRIVIPGSAIIAVIGAFWFLQRIGVVA